MNMFNYYEKDGVANYSYSGSYTELKNKVYEIISDYSILPIINELHENIKEQDLGEWKYQDIIVWKTSSSAKITLVVYTNSNGKIDYVHLLDGVTDEDFTYILNE